MLTQPELHSIYPLDPSPKPSLVYRFPNSTGLFGITEIEPDIFAVVAGNLSLIDDVFAPTVSLSGRLTSEEAPQKYARLQIFLPAGP